MNQNSQVDIKRGPEVGYLTIRFDWYRALFAAIILFTVCTRFYGLANKPYHHDESLYATYSWYIYEGRGYTYDPMLHGPFMFYFDALLFKLFGPGDFVARSSSAITGVALVCCVLLLRRRLGKLGSVIAAALFAVSPTFMYFSRFFREDIFVAFWAFLSMALFINYLDVGKRGFLFGAAASLALMFCVKENSYMYLAIFVSYPVIARVFNRMFPGHAAGPAAPYDEKRFRIAGALIALGIFWAIFYLFFTSFFSKPGGFIDGIYRKSLGYWMHQDKIQRIKGAFTHFCPIMATYELPLVVIILSGLVALLKKERWSKITLIVSTVVAVPLILFCHRELPKDPWDTRLHMTHFMHIVFALYVLVLGVTATLSYMRQGKQFHGFISYWSWTSVLLYSYAGEKVPWLLMHSLLPLTIWGSLFLSEFLLSARFVRRARLYEALIAVGLLLYLQSSLRLCFINEANPDEIMVYTQTSTDIRDSLKVISDFAEKTGKGLNFQLGVQGESTWPYTWYLRDYKDWFHPGAFTRAEKAVVVVDWEKRGDYKSVLGPNYVEKRLKLRVWWVPDPVSSLKNPVAAWLKYYFFREPWNPTKRKTPDGRISPTGSQDVAFYIRKDLVGEKMGAPAEVAAEAAHPTPLMSEKYDMISVVPPLLSFGERGSAKGRFDEPRGVWVDSDGNILVADTKNKRWQKFDSKGNCLLSVGKEGQGAGEFKDPMGIAVDGDGNIYVSDTWNHRIQKFDRDGKFLTQWQGGEGGFWAPKGMAFDRKGDLYVVDTGRHRVQKFTRDGKFLMFWGDKGEGPGQFFEPVGIAIDHNAVIVPADRKKKQKEARGEVVYVADTANRRVQKFDTSGKFLGQFGVLGWEEFYSEPFVALDAQGRLWITDSRNNRVEVFDPSGRLLCLWTAKGFQPGSFNVPIGIFIRNGKVYLSDTHNHRVQVFDRKRVAR